MQCPECQSTHIRKNGKKKGKQNHICVACGRQFIDCYDPPQGYPMEVKLNCLKLYKSGMGFRAVERATGVHHTTVMHWAKQIDQLLPDADDPNATPEVEEVGELESFMGSNPSKPGSGQQ